MPELNRLHRPNLTKRNLPKLAWRYLINNYDLDTTFDQGHMIATSDLSRRSPLIHQQQDLKNLIYPRRIY